MKDLFSPEEMNALSAQIDAQLSEIRDYYDPNAQQRGENESLKQQRQTIESNINEDADSFLKRFVQTAKEDLCLQDGLLYKQWKKWGDLDNKDVLKTFGGVLGTLGIAGGALQSVLVATSVIVLHLGIKTICKQYSE